MDDRELVERLKGGEEAAYRIILERYQTLVLNCTFKFLRDRDWAEDVTQEVFIQVFKSINSYRSEASLSTWIYRIAITRSLNHVKSMKRQKRFGILIRLFGIDRMEDHLAAEEQERPDRELENRERARILSLALDKLPENQRIAFTLSQYDAMSYADIARVLNNTIPSVESLIHRARKNLKKILYSYYRHNL
jgi:RNA polymerase sigma-70 factor, ECF subfamily